MSFKSVQFRRRPKDVVPLKTRWETVCEALVSATPIGRWMNYLKQTEE